MSVRGPGGRRVERSGEIEPIGSVIGEIVEGRRWTSGLGLGRLARRWEAVVGERLAGETRPLRLEGGVLWIGAVNAAWGAQIRFLAREIGANASPIAGVPIRDVRVVVDAHDGGR